VSQTLIECVTLYGLKKLIPQEKLTMRPSVYGIIVHEGKILLLNTRHTGKYCLPGGGVNTGERIEEALKREVREEAGIEVRVDRFAHFAEEFFYYDPLDVAFHGLLFYYHCTPLTFNLAPDDRVDDAEAEKPRWIPVETLSGDDFNDHGALVMQLLQAVMP
jgi:8-oxo-dGTP pyrophosphatase MutT (NUDIX family)